MGVLEEGVKTAGGVIDALRASPLALANLVLNVAFLVFLFYYVSRISSRAESTVAQLFQAQDKLYAQWGVVIKDQNVLTEKAMHCLLLDDALKLLQAQPRSYAPPAPAAPERPQAPRGDLKVDPPKHAPETDPPKPINFGELPIPIE